MGYGLTNYHGIQLSMFKVNAKSSSKGQDWWSTNAKESCNLQLTQRQWTQLPHSFTGGWIPLQEAALGHWAKLYKCVQSRGVPNHHINLYYLKWWRLASRLKNWNFQSVTAHEYSIQHCFMHQVEHSWVAPFAVIFLTPGPLGPAKCDDFHGPGCILFAM